MLRKKNLRRLLVTTVVCSLIVGVITSILISIYEHKNESKIPFFHVATLTDDIEDPAIWGKNFPHQYHSYLRTVDQVQTKHGGSEAVPRIPTLKDPRRHVSQSKIEIDPRLTIMWSGYAFAKDFREERGHAYMLDDQKYTERQNVVKQPGTCLNCHASIYKTMMKLGSGDLFKGFEKLNTQPYSEAVKLVTHPVGCIDCHEPTTMNLRITRPAFIEGIKNYKAHLGIKNYDVTKASPQEMRTFVCAQCHVEYYFKGQEKRLTFPWANGLKADEILKYYEQNQFKDWQHAKTDAPVLKAQHPEFELYNQGVHAAAKVACADCHMPYEKVGAFKITNHHVQSPLLNISKSCRTCHNVTEQELRERVMTIQDRTFEMRNIAMDALTEFIGDLENAKNKKTKTKSLATAQNYQRRAQFLLDFVEAENSMGFHAPQEAMRILGLSLENTRKGQKALLEK